MKGDDDHGVVAAAAAVARCNLGMPLLWSRATSKRLRKALLESSGTHCLLDAPSLIRGRRATIARLARGFFRSALQGDSLFDGDTAHTVTAREGSIQPKKRLANRTQIGYNCT